MMILHRDNHDIPVPLWSLPGLLLILVGLVGSPASLRAQDAVPAATPVTPATTTEVSDAPVAATLDSMSTLNDEAKLGDGDRVSYRVVEEQKDPILLTVSDSGELSGALTPKVRPANSLPMNSSLCLKRTIFIMPRSSSEWRPSVPTQEGRSTWRAKF